MTADFSNKLANHLHSVQWVITATCVVIAFAIFSNSVKTESKILDELVIVREACGNLDGKRLQLETLRRLSNDGRFSDLQPALSEHFAHAGGSSYPATCSIGNLLRVDKPA